MGTEVRNREIYRSIYLQIFDLQIKDQEHQAFSSGSWILDLITLDRREEELAKRWNKEVLDQDQSPGTAELKLTRFSRSKMQKKKPKTKSN